MDGAVVVAEDLGGVGGAILTLLCEILRVRLLRYEDLISYYSMGDCK